MYWKTYFGRCIYQASDVRVYQNLAYRWLTFNNPGIQTLINIKNPAKIELSYIYALSCAARQSPGSACLLGLGGGGILHALSSLYENMTLTAVEYDARIIQIAQQFFSINEIKHLNIYHDDAADFVKKNQQPYQHLLVDLYHKDSFPKHCNSLEFFKFCQTCLEPAGVLAVNLSSLSNQLCIVHYIRELFPNRTVLCPIRNTTNLIVLASQSHSLLSLIQHDRALKELYWHATWGHVAIFK
jgi:spermidine synthase